MSTQPRADVDAASIGESLASGVDRKPRRLRARWVAGVILRLTVIALGVWVVYRLLGNVIGGQGSVWALIVLWVVVAYLVLPWVHRQLVRIYVPDYFIGRTRTADGMLGDPVNLAGFGSEADLRAAMEHAGWVRAEEITLRTSWLMVKSTVTKRSYPSAPVSPLFLFGNSQDLAYQKEVGGNPFRRHHVRFWMCPDGWVLPGGQRTDWVASGTYDRGVGLSFYTLQVTHRIDEETDQERDFIIETLREAGALRDFRVIADFSTGYHARNGGGDGIRTDGSMPLLSLVKASALADST